MDRPEDGGEGVGGVEGEGGEGDHGREGFGRADLDKAEEKDNEDNEANGSSRHSKLGINLESCQFRAVYPESRDVRRQRSRERVVCRMMGRKVSTCTIEQSYTSRS